MTDLHNILKLAFRARRALEVNLIQISATNLCDKLGDSDVIDEHDVEDWLRADVERIAGLAPSRREELIALGVQMVTEMGDRDD